MLRHAYLIMAHHNQEQLLFLLSLIDDDRNDIFLHIDKKTKNFDTNKLKNSVNKSQLIIIESVNINWGGYSQIIVELKLLQTATQYGHYAYYHLLSGCCIPIKSQDYIHKFFEDNVGKEFLQFDSHNDSRIAYNRLRYYWLWQELIGDEREKKTILTLLQGVVVRFQRIIGIDRTSILNRRNLHKGPQWFSITEEFALWVLNQKAFIEKRFRHTFCADEVFLQTLITMSPFANRRYNDCLRLVMWEGGRHPRILTLADDVILRTTSALFARKFDMNMDKDLKLKKFLLMLNQL